MVNNWYKNSGLFFILVCSLCLGDAAACDSAPAIVHHDVTGVNSDQDLGLHLSIRMEQVPKEGYIGLGLPVVIVANLINQTDEVRIFLSMHPPSYVIFDVKDSSGQTVPRTLYGKKLPKERENMITFSIAGPGVGTRGNYELRYNIARQFDLSLGDEYVIRAKVVGDIGIRSGTAAVSLRSNELKLKLRPSRRDWSKPRVD